MASLEQIGSTERGSQQDLEPGRVSQWGQIAISLLRLSLCILIVAVITALEYRRYDGSTIAVLSFLIPILLISTVWDIKYTVFLSIISGVALDYFFMPPIGTLRLTDSRDWFTLGAFVFTGLVSGHLANRARNEAVNANRRRAEAETEHRRFRSLIETLPSMVFSFRPDGLLDFLSRNAQEYMGLPLEAIAGGGWEATIHPDDADAHLSKWRTCLATGQPFESEVRHRSATGEYRWFLVRAVPLRDERGSILNWYGVITDIEDRKQSEQARQEIEEQWKAAFESNPTMYFIIDDAGGILSVNPYGAEQLGYTVSELVGTPVLNVFYAPDRQFVQEHANACLEQPGRMMRWEARKIRKNGTMLWVRETANAVILKERLVILVVCEDITEQKRAEDAARRSERELRDVIESVPAMVFVALPGPSNVFASRGWREYTGLSSEDTAGIGWQSAVHPNDLERYLETWRVCSVTGDPVEDEARFRRAADGEYRWFLVRAMPLRDEHGDIVKWYGVLTDIEDRKRAEALLTGEKRILEMVAKGDSLDQILDGLCRLVEEQANDVMASILLVEGNLLRHGGAPSLPKTYMDMIDGVAIGPSVGSCRTAAYSQKQVIVEDIATDPLWTDFRAAALTHSLRACWSTPILSTQDEVIGTFAMYYRQPRRPSLRDQEIIEQITHLAGVAIERKLTQEALRRSEAYLAEAQRLTKTGSWAYNPSTGKTIYWSAEMFRILGLDPQKGPSSEDFWQLVHPDDLGRVRERVEREAYERKEYVDEYRIVCPDGAIKHVLDIGHPAFDEARDFVEFVGTTVDVTERKLAEEALRESEELKRRIIESSRDCIKVLDLDGTLLFMSNGGQQLLEIDNIDDYLNTCWIDFWRPEDRPKIVEAIAAARAGGIGKFQGFSPSARGAPRWWDAVITPICNADGQPEQLLSVSRDITEAKRAEEALRRSEAHLTEAQKLTHTGSWAYDRVRDRWIHFSEELYRIFGLDPQKGEPLLDELLERIHPGDRLRIGEINLKSDRQKEEHAVDFRIQLSDGTVKYLHSTRHPVLNEAGEIVEARGTTIDVTERKRAEEQLHASETRFRTYVDHATDALFVRDEQGKILDMNRQACESLGYTREELIGATPSLFDRSLDEAAFRKLNERLAAGDLVTFETIHRRKDGTRFPVEVRIRPFQHGGHRFTLSIARNISERKRAEQERERLRQMEEDLARINRVSMMGELTASMAHEIKQPIAAAVSNAEACLQWLAHDQPDLAEVREAATEMVNEARRAAEIMTRIRSLFKKQETRREVLDLNEVITDTVFLISEEADRRSIPVRTELDTELPNTWGDRVQLQQVLINLMLNGLEAMDGAGGELTIRSQRDQEGHPLISVKDAGIGLPAGEGDKIFDAFFTTKPQGTGMGLAISRSIIESHGGRLWGTANAGSGATFSFSLPAATDTQNPVDRGREFPDTAL